MAKTAFEQTSGKNTSWAFDTLFKSQINIYDWVGALETLDIAEKRKILEKNEIRRRRAVLLSARAAELEASGDQENACETSKRAAGMAPEFAPATSLAARLLAQDGQTKKAGQLIEKSWAKAPHPALAQAYKNLWQDEEEKTQIKKIKALIKTNPTHRESIVLSAEQALDSNDGVAAISILDPLLQSAEPSARLCLLSARAEDLLQNTIDARTWQNRAACAPIEENWSDLDPNSPAFNYTNEDWQRLVTSFGASGTLIHPRYEAYKHHRPIRNDLVDGSSPPQEEKSATPFLAPRTDDPGIDNDVTTSGNLADRLENLLDDKTKS